RLGHRRKAILLFDLLRSSVGRAGCCHKLFARRFELLCPRRNLFPNQPALPTLDCRKCLYNLLLRASAGSKQPTLQPALPCNLPWPTRVHPAFGQVGPTGEFVTRGLSMPHSPRWHDGRLWLLESGTGQLVLVDPAVGSGWRSCPASPAAWH